MKRPEQALQIQTASFLRLALKPPTVWTAFPAGGGGRLRGAFLKAMGLAPGWPDLLVMHPNRAGGGPIILGIELKAKSGRITPHQRAVMERFHECKAWYVLCRSIEEVEAALKYVGIPMAASISANPLAGKKFRDDTAEECPQMDVA